MQLLKLFHCSRGNQLQLQANKQMILDCFDCCALVIEASCYMYRTGLTTTASKE